MLPSYYDAIRPLPDEQRLALYDAIMDYAFGGKEPDDLPPILKGYFVLLRPNINSSAKRYAASVGNGKKGGRPPKRTQEKPEKNPAETQEKPSKNQEKEKDKDKEMDTERGGGESEPQAPSPPSAPPVIGLPLNDGTEYGVTEGQCREWAELYPAVDILQQLRNMRGWLLSNAERRKTRRGIKRFVTGWLSREQDRGRNCAGGGGSSYGRTQVIPSDADYLEGWEDVL